jgi:hypothetical protein
MKWRAVGFVVIVVVFAVGLAGYRVGHSHRPPPGENAGDGQLVATKLIPKGTPGSVVATNVMYAPVKLPEEEVEDGAISDPSYLRGRTSVVDILPGQQLTATDFMLTP